MVRLASDADVLGEIIRGLRRQEPGLDLVRVQDVLAPGTPDVLAWAASEDRIRITNDRSTMTGFVYQRLAAGEDVPGVIVTTRQQPTGAAINDILLLITCLSPQEFRELVLIYLPYR